MKVEATRVVLDTNVWISAALSRDGAPAKVVRRVLVQGSPVFTSATFDELQTRLWRPKFDRYISMDLRKSLLHDLNALALWVQVPDPISAVRHSRDPIDDKFIHAALASQARWLITGDQDLLCLAPLAGMDITTPALGLAHPGFCAA